MQIEKATHKAFLYKLFLSGNQFRSFPLDKLMDAASVVKKLTSDTVKKIDTNTKVESIQFNVSEIEFSAEEWVLLKELFKEIKVGTITEATIIEELKGVFQ